MKSFLKKHLVIICTFSVLILFLAIGVGEYLKLRLENKNFYNTEYANCIENPENYVEREEYCEDMELWSKKKIYNLDTISTFFHFTTAEPIYYLQLLAILFVVIPAVWQFQKEQQTGAVKNILMRMKYSKYIRKSILLAYKKALIFPIFLVLMFTVAFLVSGHFDIENQFLYNPGTLPIDIKYLDMLPLFVFYFLINFILHSIFWINISFIVAKKSKNIISNIILTFLIFIVFELFIQIILAKIPFLLFGIWENLVFYLTSVNIWNYEGINYLLIKTIVPVIYILLTVIILKKQYRSKEDLIICDEQKN